MCVSLSHIRIALADERGNEGRAKEDASLDSVIKMIVTGNVPLIMADEILLL